MRFLVACATFLFVDSVALAQSRPPPTSGFHGIKAGRGGGGGGSAGSDGSGSGRRGGRGGGVGVEEDDSLDREPVPDHRYVMWRVTDDPMAALAGRTCYARTALLMEPMCGLADCLEEGEKFLTWGFEIPAAGKAGSATLCKSKWKSYEVSLQGKELTIQGQRRAPGVKTDEAFSEKISGVKVYSNGKTTALIGHVQGASVCSPFSRQRSRLMFVCPERPDPDGRLELAFDRWIPMVDAGAGKERAEKVGSWAAVAMGQVHQRPSADFLVLGDVMAARPGIEWFFQDTSLNSQVDKASSILQTSIGGEIVRRVHHDKLGGDDMLLSVGSQAR